MGRALGRGGGVVARIIETSLIECRGDLAMIGALQLLAVVAYPRDWSKRDKFMMAVGREGVTQWKRRHKVKRTPASHRAAVVMPAEDAAAAVDRGLELIGYRILAASAYGWAGFMRGLTLVSREDMENCGFYREHYRRIPPSFTRALVKFGAVDGVSDSTIWRHWKDTSPVLHLACVVQQAMQRHTSLFALLESAPCWLQAGLVRAENLRRSMTVGSREHPAIREQIRLIPTK